MTLRISKHSSRLLVLELDLLPGLAIEDAAQDGEAGAQNLTVRQDLEKAKGPNVP